MTRRYSCAAHVPLAVPCQGDRQLRGRTEPATSVGPGAVRHSPEVPPCNVTCKVSLPCFGDIATKTGGPYIHAPFAEVGNRQRSRGQSVVEFALMLPIFLILIFGGIDFGRVFLGWINLNNTARIAANYAARTRCS